MAARMLPVSRMKYKITLWLHPAEYWALMHASAMLGNGKLSFHKWFKKAAEIENAKALSERHPHELAALTKGWGKVKYRTVAGQRVAVGLRKALPPVARAKRNSPRRLAA